MSGLTHLGTLEIDLHVDLLGRLSVQPQARLTLTSDGHKERPGASKSGDKHEGGDSRAHAYAVDTAAEQADKALSVGSSGCNKVTEMRLWQRAYASCAKVTSWTGECDEDSL